MENSKIHMGFPNSELRDFLSFSLVKNFELEFNNNTSYVIVPSKGNNDGIEYGILDGILDAQRMIDFYQTKITILRERGAILTLIKMNGWEEFDVSDETTKDIKFRLWATFIGTKQEYNQLMCDIKKEKIISGGRD